MNLVVAANAMGFATSWLTEWYAYDRRVLDALGLASDESIAGFIHIGRLAGNGRPIVCPARARLHRRTFVSPPCSTKRAPTTTACRTIP